MSNLNTIITRLDGTTYNLNELGVVTRDFNVSAPDYDHETYEIEGRAGHVTIYTQLKARSISVLFYMRAYDNGDYAAARADVFPLFESSEPFYIADGRQPSRLWLVRQDGDYELDQNGRYGFFEVGFVADLPYSRSKGKAGDPLTWDADLIAWGDGYEWDTEPPSVTFNTSSFEVINMGNVAVDSVSTPLTISLKGTFDAGVTINNNTTGDTFTYSGALTLDDTLSISGISVLKNDVNVFAATNHKTITLAPGPNEIEIVGGTVSEVHFDFYYYYL